MEGPILKLGMIETASQEVLPSPHNLNLLAKSHAEAAQLFQRGEEMEHMERIDVQYLPEDTQPNSAVASGEYNFGKRGTSEEKKPRNIANQKTMDSERMKNKTQDTGKGK